MVIDILSNETWTGSYEGGRNTLIVPEAFAHPAKMSYALLKRIITFGLEQGFWHRGNVLGDPFGGIGTTGIVGAYHGLRVVAVELEPRFVAMAQENFELHRRKWEAAGDPMPVGTRKRSYLMHAICEVVLPPTIKDLKAAVEEVLAPFSECTDDEDASGFRFWDFWVIGGRFSGAKLEASLDADKLKAFHDALKERKVTVAGFTCGKQEIKPESQIAMVDSLWREHFPGRGNKCILFQHGSIDQYGKDGIYAQDVCRVSEVPERYEAEKLIVADFKTWSKEKSHEIEATRFLSMSYWNGVDHQNSDWDGNVKGGLKRIMEESKDWKKCGLKDDWLCVTVDFHT